MSTTIQPARKLEPYVWPIHRRDELRRYVDLTAALPNGVTVTSGTVEWARRWPSGLVDATASFGAPAVQVDPTEVPAPGGGTRGGPGTVLFEPEPDSDLVRGRYELLLTLHLSNGEVVTYGGIDDLTDWADVPAPAP